jgi:deazaflavin-dependent oxidoreductase (nitroreductase family)
MPMARGITRINKRFINPVMLRLAGIGPMVDLEHVGRRTGTVRHTPLMAFRQGDVVTIALTYGPDVQWLANVRHSGGCRMRMGGEVLKLGAPRLWTRPRGWPASRGPSARCCGGPSGAATTSSCRFSPPRLFFHWATTP